MEKIAALLCVLVVLAAGAVFLLGSETSEDIDGRALDDAGDAALHDDDRGGPSGENAAPAPSRSTDEDTPPVRSLVGRVVDRESGRAVPGAIVTLRERPSLKTSSRRSGADGTFRFGQLEGETVRYDIWAEAGRRTCPLRSGDAPALNTRIDIGTLTLESSVAIRGTVRTSDGIPIEGASVYLIPHRVVPSLGALDMFGVFDRLFVDELIVATRTTDAHGSFVFDRAATGAFALAAFAEGHAGKYSDLVLADHGPSIPVEIRLDRGHVLEGVVVDEEDSPVVGAELALLSESGRRALMLKTVKAVSDESGRFRFPSVEPMPKILFARAEGFASNAVTGVDTTAADELRIVMSRGLRVAGRVVDQDDGEGVEGIRVGVMGYARPTFGQAVTDANGGFVIPHAPADGTRYLIVDHPSHDLVLTEEQRAESFMGGLKLGEDRTGDLLLTVARGGRVVGRVIDMTSGEPLAGVTVSHVSDGRARRQVATRPPRKALTDGAGRFTLDGVPPGPVRLAVQAGLAAPLPTASGAPFTTVVEDWDGRRELPDVALEVGGPITLSGTVANEKGPVAGARVRLYSTSALRPHRAGRPSRRNAALARSTTTDEEGRFKLGPAPRELDVTIIATHPDHPDPVEMNLRTGDVSVEGLALKLVQGAALSGRAVNTKGEAVTGLAVTFRGATGRASGAVTDAEGRFRIEGLTAGAGVLRTPSPTHIVRNGDLLLAAGREKEAVFEVRPAGIVQGLMDPLFPGAVGSVGIRLMSGGDVTARTTVRADGNYRLTKIPVGRYTIDVVLGHGTSSEVVVEVGHVDVLPGVAVTRPIKAGDGE